MASSGSSHIWIKSPASSRSGAKEKGRFSSQTLGRFGFWVLDSGSLAASSKGASGNETRRVPGERGSSIFYGGMLFKKIVPKFSYFPSEMAMVLFTPGLCHGSFLPALPTAFIVIFLLLGNSRRLLILTVSSKAQGTASSA